MLGRKGHTQSATDLNTSAVQGHNSRMYNTFMEHSSSAISRGESMVKSQSKSPIRKNSSNNPYQTSIRDNDNLLMVKRIEVNANEKLSKKEQRELNRRSQAVNIDSNQKLINTRTDSNENIRTLSVVNEVP